MDPCSNSVSRPPATLALGAITLTRWRSSDLEPLFAAVTRSIEHLRPWLAFAGEHSRDSIARFLADSDSGWERGEHFRYAIRDRDGTIAGSIALMARIGPNGREIGYWVGARHVHRGIATLAAAALTERGLALAGVEHIEIHHDEANLASAAIPARLGFRKLGTFAAEPKAPADAGRDVRWRLDAADFAASPACALLAALRARTVTPGPSPQRTR